MTRLISNESDVLSQYGKTILMLILARVNDYYNPYIPQTFMEEEAKIMHGEVFSPAEKEFFKHRLHTLYPKIGDRDVKTAITLLAEQKTANCPCLVHTDQRDYEWIVFRRQPDRIPYEDEDEEDVTPMDEVSDDEDFFSAEAEETMPIPTSDERTQVDQDIQAEQIGVLQKQLQKKLIFLLLIFLLVTRPQINPRCPNHCVNHPYTPGTNPNPNLQPRRRVIRKRRN